MRHVNASGSDQERFAPGVREGRDVRRKRHRCGCETVDRIETHRRYEEHFSCLRAARYGASHGFANSVLRSGHADRDFSAGGVRNYIWCVATRNHADVQAAAPEKEARPGAGESCESLARRREACRLLIRPPKQESAANVN